jgi:hypothetical protein
VEAALAAKTFQSPQPAARQSPHSALLQVAELVTAAGAWLRMRWPFFTV